MSEPSSAPLLSGFFQVAYVTTDLEQAMDLYRRNYGVREFLATPEWQVGVKTALGPKTANIRIAFVYIGATQVELIQQLGGDCRIYAEGLPTSGFGLRFHHLGHRLFGGPEVWENFRSAVDETRHPIAIEGTGSRFIYTDERNRLGHYMEYMWLDAQGAAFFDSIPRQ